MATTSTSSPKTTVSNARKANALTTDICSRLVSPEVAAALDPSRRKKVLEMVQVIPPSQGVHVKPSQLVKLVLTNVYKNDASPDKGTLKRAVDDLARHVGSGPILAQFFAAMNEFDPYRAFARAKRQPSTQSEAKKANAKVVNEKVVGASGATLVTDTLHFVYDPASKNKGAGLFMGTRAFLNLFSVFGPATLGEMKGKSPDEVEKQRQERKEEQALLLKNINQLRNLLDKSGTETTVGTDRRTIVRAEAYLNTLREEIAKLQGDLLRSRFGNGLRIEALEPERVRSDPGRQLLGWCEEQIKLNRLPETLAGKFHELLDPVTSPTPERAISILAELSAYRMANTFVEKKAVFKELASDVQVLNGLPSNDPLRTKHLQVLEFARTTNAQLLYGREGDISIQQYIEFLKNSDIVSFRAAFNERFFKAHESEYRAAADYFRSLFKNPDGTWRTDSFNESLPLHSRLDHTVLGKKIGGEKGHALLTADEFRHIRAMLMIDPRASDLNEMLSAIPTAQLQPMFWTVRGAHLKALSLEAKIGKIRDFDSIPDGFSALRKKDIPTGSGFAPLQQLLAGTDLTLGEFIRRARWYAVPPAIRKAKLLSLEEETGLYRKADEALLKKQIATTASYVHRGTAHERLDQAAQALGHPLFHASPSILRAAVDNEAGKFEYLTVDRMKELNALLYLFSNLPKDWRENIAASSELRERLYRPLRKPRFTGGLSGTTLAIREEGYSLQNAAVFVEQDSVRFIDPIKAVAFCSSWESQNRRLRDMSVTDRADISALVRHIAAGDAVSNRGNQAIEIPRDARRVAAKFNEHDYDTVLSTQLISALKSL